MQRLRVNCWFEITHVPEIRKKAGASWLPSQLFPGLSAGDRGVSPHEEPEKAEMLNNLLTEAKEGDRLRILRDAEGSEQ
jgi:hypothetical protein